MSEYVGGSKELVFSVLTAPRLTESSTFDRAIQWGCLMTNIFLIAELHASSILYVSLKLLRTIGCVLKPEEENEVIGTKQIIWTFFILLEKRSLETVVSKIMEILNKSRR